MTVCIAATCDLGARGGHKIVLCTDWRSSGLLGRTDTKLKQKLLSGGWSCLTAGDEPDVNALARLYEKEFSAAGQITDANIGDLIRRPLQQRRKDKANEYTHGKYGISYDDFVAFGRDKLPPDLFRDAMLEISNISLRADFILAGFSDRDPMLWETTGKGVASIKEDFAVAGEGAYLAASVLLQREQSEICSLATTLYHVYEAKKYAERVTSVGEYTTIRVVKHDGSFKSVSIKGLERLEATFEKYGPKEIDAEPFAIDGAFLD